MENNLTLEQEVLARIFLHKVAITGGVLMQDYIQKQQNEIPAFLIEEQADKYSDFIIKQALQDGTFDSLYADAWERVKYEIPENLKVV